MGALIALPLAQKAGVYAIGALAVVLILLGVFAYGIHYGSAECKAGVAAAVAKQQADDKALSDTLLTRQKGALDALHTQTLSALQKVSSAPITNTCGPVQRDASHSVQSIVRGSP